MPTPSAYKIIDHSYDVVVVGAGGSGLRATMGSAGQGLKTACITKVFPTRSHTVAAQGGIAARSATWGRTTGPGTCTTPSRARTGSATRTRSSICAARRRPAVYELEHSGVPFSRTAEGRIYQRAFGGMMQNMGAGPPAQRTGAAADRTGHAMLHALYQQSLKYDAGLLHRIFRARPDHGRRRVPAA
jgi:succinate dehydrogenase / fumarate reductase flavoprotein subunit